VINNKRILVILAVLGLTMTVCAGLGNTTKDEESITSVAETQEESTKNTDDSGSIKQSFCKQNTIG